MNPANTQLLYIAKLALLVAVSLSVSIGNGGRILLPSLLAMNSCASLVNIDTCPLQLVEFPEEVPPELPDYNEQTEEDVAGSVVARRKYADVGLRLCFTAKSNRFEIRANARTKFRLGTAKLVSRQFQKDCSAHLRC